MWNKPKRFGKHSIYSSSLFSSPLLPTSLPSVRFTSPNSCALPQFSLLLLLCSPYALMPPPLLWEEGGNDSVPWHAWQGCSWTLHLQRHKNKLTAACSITACGCARTNLSHTSNSHSQLLATPFQPPLFISRHFYFPAFIFFSVPTLLLLHKQQQANYKIGARCLEGGSGLSHGPLSFEAPATHERTRWEPVGTVFVLRWQEYPRRARVICAKIAFGTWEPQPPWPWVFQKIQPRQNSHFDWGLREKRYKVYETRGKTSDISFWSMASATCLPPPPLPP